MEKLIYNPQKGRLETIDTEEITKNNTTWFDDCGENDEIEMITDHKDGLLIGERGHSYPVLIYDISRADINNDKNKAKQLIDNMNY